MANIVRQLKNKSGDNIFPLGVMAGSHTKMTLLWTNSSPTASFAAQTVSLDLSGYDMVMVVSRESTTESGTNSELATVGTTTTLFVNRMNASAVSTGWYGWRDATVATTGITFSTGSYAYVDISRGYAASANHCIPVYIYGIKLNAQNIQGDPSVYSTSETVVGTWIDGKPIYRRVFTGSMTSTQTTVATGLSTIRLRNVYGMAADGQIPIGSYVNSSWSCGAYFSSGTLYLFGTSATTSQSYELVIEYTKTTD